MSDPLGDNSGERARRERDGAENIRAHEALGGHGTITSIGSGARVC